MKRTMKTKSYICSLLVTLLTLSGASLGTAQPGDAKKEYDQRLQDLQSRTGQQSPTESNKASSLVGMDVRNPGYEKLGSIKDIVINFETGQISYAVLAVNNGVLGLNEKLLAVPVKAFRPDAGGEYLILHTDQEKLAMAAGFSKDNWPSVSNPAWGAEPFWTEPDEATDTEEDETTPVPDSIP